MNGGEGIVTLPNNNLDMIKLRLLAFILLLITCSITNISAITRTVDINGTGQYTSIQAGINASTSADTVLVYPGRYLENVIIQRNNITLVSLEYITGNPAYIDSTIIDGNHVNACLKIYQNYQNIKIRGFSITNGGPFGTGGIGLHPNSNSRFENCNVYGNEALNGAGMSVNECTTFLSGVKIFDNHAANLGGGLYIYGYMGTVNVTFDPVNRCSIYNNTAGVGQDIFAHSINNDLSIPLYMYSVPNPSSYYATAYRSYGNNFQLNIDFQVTHHQEINSDLFVSSNGDDNNDGLTPQTPLKTIHTAIYRIASDSLNQKTVHLLPGVYSFTGNQQKFSIALKSWVRVIGSGTENTIIVGEPNPQFTYLYMIIFRAFYESNFFLGNLSITSSFNNNTAISGMVWDRAVLSNLHIYDFNPDSDAVISFSLATNCVLENVVIDNIITPEMGVISGTFNGMLKNCTFRNITSTYSDPDAWADPLFWMGIKGDVTFENCLFDQITMMDNDSRAIQLSGSNDPEYQNRLNLINCRFTDFTCQSDIIVISSANNPIININNCTFAGSAGNASMLYINGIVNVANSIFYNDTLSEIRLYNYTGFQNNLTVDYSCLRRGQTGISPSWGSIVNYLPTNISSEPVFVGDNTGYLYKYYLSDISPCINAGTPDTTGLALPELDILGNPRLFGGRIDMGAYEWNGTSIEDDYTPQAVFNDVRIYPNPFRDDTTFHYNLGKEAMVDISIYNAKGQRIKHYQHNRVAKGSHSLNWDGKDNLGLDCSSGIYIVKMTIDRKTIASKKITLIR
jgi:hypothetical protein